MGIIQRGIVFAIGTTSNAILFLFHSRVILEVIAVGKEVAGKGPATDAMNLLPMGIQLAIGGLQVGLILYLIGGLGKERSAARRPLQ